VLKKKELSGFFLYTLYYANTRMYLEAAGHVILTSANHLLFTENTFLGLVTLDNKVCICVAVIRDN
jgi:hypothetical protein